MPVCLKSLKSFLLVRSQSCFQSLECPIFDTVGIILKVLETITKLRGGIVPFTYSCNALNMKTQLGDQLANPVDVYVLKRKLKQWLWLPAITDKRTVCLVISI